LKTTEMPRLLKKCQVFDVLVYLSLKSFDTLIITTKQLNDTTAFLAAATAKNKQVGRPRVTTRYQDVNIGTWHQRDRLKSSAAMIARKTRGSHGSPYYGNKRHTKGPILTDKLSRDHMQWSRNHLRYTHRQCSSVLFNESRWLGSCVVWWWRRDSFVRRYNRWKVES